jgi:molecular chaperone Hsp33
MLSLLLLILLVVMLLLLSKYTSSIRIGNRASSRLINRQHLTSSSSSSSSLSLSSSSSSQDNELDTSDVLITGLNFNQDISVKVVSCRELIQECIIRNDLSAIASKALGEVMTCSLMMGAGLKEGETIQVNLVGNTGLQNIMAISDGDLRTRGLVGKPRFSMALPPLDDEIKTRDILGEGQIQVVRNHPTWKKPQNGIVALRDTKISLNLALYMVESEQRSAIMLTDIKVEGNLCRHALGIMVERLPGCTEENVEISIKNLEAVEKKGLRSYLDRSNEEVILDDKMFRSMDPPLNKMLDDCLNGMGEDIRWCKIPKFRCSCGPDKIIRTLKLIPREEVNQILAEQNGVEVKCDFCGKAYSLTTEQVIEQVLNAPKE